MRYAGGSEAARIEADFLTLSENVNSQFHSYCGQDNIIVMGEHLSARQMTRDFYAIERSQMQRWCFDGWATGKSSNRSACASCSFL